MMNDEDEDQLAPCHFSYFDTQVVLHGLAVDSVAWPQALGSFIGHVIQAFPLNQGRIALFLGEAIPWIANCLKVTLESSKTQNDL